MKKGIFYKAYYSENVFSEGVISKKKRVSTKEAFLIGHFMKGQVADYVIS